MVPIRAGCGDRQAAAIVRRGDVGRRDADGRGLDRIAGSPIALPARDSLALAAAPPLDHRTPRLSRAGRPDRARAATTGGRCQALGAPGHTAAAPGRCRSGRRGAGGLADARTPGVRRGNRETVRRRSIDRIRPHEFCALFNEYHELLKTTQGFIGDFQSWKMVLFRQDYRSSIRGDLDARNTRDPVRREILPSPSGACLADPCSAGPPGDSPRAEAAAGVPTTVRSGHHVPRWRGPAQAPRPCGPGSGGTDPSPSLPTRCGRRRKSDSAGAPPEGGAPRGIRAPSPGAAVYPRTGSISEFFLIIFKVAHGLLTGLRAVVSHNPPRARQCVPSLTSS